MIAILVSFLPLDPLVRLGVLLVLLTPCIDYVVTFSHLGRADARLLLVVTPTLLVVQMLLPVFLGLFLGNDTATFVQPGPFVYAFVWLIAVPLALAVPGTDPSRAPVRNAVPRLRREYLRNGHPPEATRFFAHIIAIFDPVFTYDAAV